MVINGLYTNIRENGAVCDLGTSLVPFKDIYSNGSIVGTINSRLTNDIVSNTSTGTLNNLVSFLSNKVIKDTGFAASQITTNTTNIATNTTNITTLQTKTQNRSATAGNTNFTGTLQQAGVNVLTTAGLVSKVSKSGDSMSGNLNMALKSVINENTLSGARFG